MLLVVFLFCILCEGGGGGGGGGGGQPRSQGLKGKALGTRLEGRGGGVLPSSVS